MSNSHNPFSVTSPENLSDDLMVQLFVDVYSDFPKIKMASHTFIHGSRGTGKSMMLRYLEPTVQMKANKCTSPTGLDFFAIHVPIKTSNLSRIEFSRFEGAPYFILAEHMLVMHCLVKISETLAKVCNESCKSDELQVFFEKSFLNRLRLKQSIPTSCQNYFREMISIAESIYNEAQTYISKHAFIKEDILPYEGNLFGWLDFLVPFIKDLQSLSFIPNKPFFLMLDDADNLEENMQKIINTWVSTRVIENVCLKVSTQLRYKTYQTVSGAFIESPHDYTDIDITKVYSSKTTKFYERAREIALKRINIHSQDNIITPEDFFPPDEAQELRLKELADEIRKKNEEGEGRAQRPSDDVTRYLRPEYIRRLGRSAHSYSYAGFKSIVDLSSGIIRWFLEPAALMYSDCQSVVMSSPITNIPHGIQDAAIKKWSKDFLDVELQKLETSAKRGPNELDQLSKLRNLIDGVGMLFQRILTEESLSERRIFTIMLTAPPSYELSKVLDLGVQYSYFQRSTVGSKEGYGRNMRFSLSRRLGPYYKLDVSGFAGNLSVTPEMLQLALRSPKTFADERFKKLLLPSSEIGHEQLSLFGD